MSHAAPTIVLFHQDLRLADNRALHSAAERGPVIPLYIYDESMGRPLGGASRWWLHQALKDLADNLAKHSAPLILRRGKTAEILQDIIKTTGAKAVAWNRRYEPAPRAADEKLEKILHTQGIDVSTHEGFLLFEPGAIRTGQGTPFKVYTPFSKACFAAPAPSKPVAAPTSLAGVKGIASDNLDDWKLVPRTATWPQGLADAWEVSEAAAHERLHDFLHDNLAAYKTARDLPDRDGTSKMSPYLHFGLIGPHHIWHAVHKLQMDSKTNSASVERYLLEILWREFSWHLLHHFPDLPNKPWNASFAAFPWRDDAKGVLAWQKGMTGYPIVDAGMRQLWQTGWMHNRVRMIVASFLIKHLLIDWREGEAWFWDTLVDADLGNNAASWQWVAGSGADAAPFFRIFNPILQGKKFDPDGAYVRTFVPELAELSSDYIHEPWRAPKEEMFKARVTLGKNYPEPIVDHDGARKRALAALKGLKDPQAAIIPEDLFD